ncbi:MAG TPA: F0F1 ATP synthase subunit epsilon [Methylomirabilota bacterium]|jgi:F-type H+-transporting ATPase subunit epsilon|nr:F0F1 ATP synthase subunit epsilon [Methylomirabilota bacterium]
MAERLTLELATPTRMVVAETVDEVVVPGSEGYFGVLPGHAPLLATLGIGELTYRSGREERHVAVSGGFAEVRNDKVIVLADSAETPQDIDRARAERARERAEQRLSGRTQEEVDYTRAAAALARALARLQVAGRGR